MASTYTTNLRLTKQGDGENPNSWGQILNDGVISLADSAVAGYTQVSVGSTTSVALTQNNGSSDQSRSAFLEFTGSIGSAHTSIFVLIPNNSKGYVVRNSVSYNANSNVLMIRVAGNTGVTIPSGTNKHIITDGTSIYEISQDSFTNLTVEGNVTVEGNMVVSGAATFNTTTTVVGAATFKNAVSVSGAVKIGGTLQTAGNTSVGGTLVGTGAATFSSNVTVAGNVNVAGNTSIGGTATVTGAFVAGGAVALNSTVTVVGAATFKDDVSVSGAVNMGSTLDVNSNASIGGTLLTTGKATFKNAVSVSGDTVINGSTVLAGTARLDSTVTVAGAAVFKGDVHVSSKVCASAYYGDGSNLTGSIPTGTILPWSVTVAPTGYVLCDGTAISRSTYSDLFAVVSSLYGSGDGSSTFNVPDLRGRFMAGWNAGTSRLTSVTADMVVGDSMAATGGRQDVTLAVAQIPVHTHELTSIFSSNAEFGGADGLKRDDTLETGASMNTSSAGGGGSHSNIPPVLMINYVIKT
jgi:microcystin-dependent protein/predicted acyltransferase (DUF342 family)